MIYTEGFNGTSTNTTIDNYLSRRGHDVFGDQFVGTGRLSGVCLRMYGNRYWSIPASLNNTYTIGFALKSNDWVDKYTSLIKFLYLMSDSGTSEHITLAFASHGEIAIITQAETVYTSDLRGKDDSWMYVEFKFVIHNTTGSYILKVNGQELLNRSGIDTYHTGDVGVDEFHFDYKGGGFYIDIDDVYVHSDFLGDSRVDDIHPDGDGASSQFTPVPGVTDNYVEVDDDDTPDDDATYVQSATTTDQDLYTYTNLAALGTIHAVQMNVTCRETDGSDFNIEQLVRLSGTTYDEAPSAIAGETYETLARVMEVDPNTTAAWVVANINSGEFGFEVTT